MWNRGLSTLIFRKRKWRIWNKHAHCWHRSLKFDSYRQIGQPYWQWSYNWYWVNFRRNIPRYDKLGYGHRSEWFGYCIGSPFSIPLPDELKNEFPKCSWLRGYDRSKSSEFQWRFPGNWGILENNEWTAWLICERCNGRSLAGSDSHHSRKCLHHFLPWWLQPSLV